MQTLFLTLLAILIGLPVLIVLYGLGTGEILWRSRWVLSHPSNARFRIAVLVYLLIAAGALAMALFYPF